MRDLEKVKEFFSKDIFATQTTGIVIEEVDDGYAKCSLKIEEKHLAANNQIMGGAIFTMADFTFAVAANDEDHFVATSNSNISYISMAKDKTLIAECRCLKQGKKMGFYETTITDGLGNLIAVVSNSGVTISRN